MSDLPLNIIETTVPIKILETNATMEIIETTVTITTNTYNQEKIKFEAKFNSLDRKNSLLRKSKPKQFDSADYYLNVLKLKHAKKI